MRPPGVGRSTEMGKAEEEVREYAFPVWLNPFITPCDSMCNIEDENLCGVEDTSQKTQLNDLPNSTDEEKRADDEDEGDNGD